MADPAVTLVIPVVTGSAGLAGSIASILGQSYPGIDALAVVNPALRETDVAQELRRHEPRLRWIAAPEDGNAPALLRVGQKAARGQFFGWLSPGDLYDPRKVAWQMAMLAGRMDRIAGSRARRIGLADPAPPASSDREDAEALWSLLGGDIDPATILAPLSCLDAVGGFDPAFGAAYELDLAVRLAARFRYVQVPANLLRRHSAPAPESAAAEELHRICQRLLDANGARRKRLPLRRLADAERALRRRPGLDVFPLLAERVSQTLTPADLAVVAVGREAAADLTEWIGRVGLPPGALVWMAAGADHLAECAASALQRTEAARLVLVDAAAPPSPELLQRQLLHAEAAGLDACLPMADPLVFDGTPGPSLLAGTLFRRTAFEAAVPALAGGEQRFWAAFGRIGRIGALPPVPGGVPRPSDRLADALLPARRTQPGRHPQVSLPSDRQLADALFDRAWYLANNPDVAAAGADPLLHYQAHGWHEGRDPNPWFDTWWYLAGAGEQVSFVGSPLEHFVAAGAALGVRPHPGFDVRWYSRRYLGADSPIAEALRHFLLSGLAEGAVPDPRLDRPELRHRIAAVPAAQRTPLIQDLQASLPSDRQLIDDLFDSACYLANNPDVAATGEDPLAHYQAHGWREGRDPNPWFDTWWYLAQAGEQASFAGSPLEHFVTVGAARGLRPHPGFDVRWYSRRYLGADSPIAEALRHFLRSGLAEGAVPDPRLDRPKLRHRVAAVPSAQRTPLIRHLFDELSPREGLLAGLIDFEWYLATYPDIAAAGDDPVAHYQAHGWREGRDPNPWFSTAWYLAQMPEASRTHESPLAHFVAAGSIDGIAPHPEFAIGWYARRYLSADTPAAEALRHFIGPGLADGAVPDPRLDTPEVRSQVLACPVGERSALLRRLLLKLRADAELIAALVDADWYRSLSGIDEGVVPLEHYRRSGWRDGLNPNPWFDTRWYLSQNPELEPVGICPLEHFVGTGAASGRNPDPAFDIAWYCRRYLGSTLPMAEGLRHFLTAGIAAGAVPDARLDGAGVRDRLLEVPLPDRSVLVRRLHLLAAHSTGVPQPWSPDAADLWPLLLRCHVPPGVLPVLIVCPHGSDAAEMAAAVLPIEECALFGLLVGDERLEIADRANGKGLSVAFTLPDEAGSLKQFLAALQCRRGAVMPPELAQSTLVRWIRDAGLPVYVNGPNRAAER